MFTGRTPIDEAMQKDVRSDAPVRVRSPAEPASAPSRPRGTDDVFDSGMPTLVTVDLTDPWDDPPALDKIYYADPGRRVNVAVSLGVGLGAGGALSAGLGHLGVLHSAAQIVLLGVVAIPCGVAVVTLGLGGCSYYLWNEARRDRMARQFLDACEPWFESLQMPAQPRFGHLKVLCATLSDRWLQTNAPVPESASKVLYEIAKTLATAMKPCGSGVWDARSKAAIATTLGGHGVFEVFLAEVLRRDDVEALGQLIEIGMLPSTRRQCARVLAARTSHLGSKTQEWLAHPFGEQSEV